MGPSVFNEAKRARGAVCAAQSSAAMRAHWHRRGCVALCAPFLDLRVRGRLQSPVKLLI
jgi:hypothetical protein